MFLNHIGVINKNAEEAERFYQGFLGLDKQKDLILPPELSEELFSVKGEIRLMAFGMGDQKVEVFIYPYYNLPSPNIPHMGLLVDNFQEIIDKAGKNGVRVIKGSHNEKTVYFIMDFSGNMIEIKPSS